MSADLSALADPTDLGPESPGAEPGELGSLCACGCGQRLPVGSTREYKRGHRDNPPPREPYTLEDAARDTPDDAPPADQDSKAPAIRITKRVREDIQGKLGMMYGFVALGVQMRDPFCGQALEDNADSITEKMVPIICKSPELVKWFTRGSGYMVWFELVMVFMPVLKVVFQHHVTKTIGQEGRPPQIGDPVQPNPADYTRYAA